MSDEWPIVAKFPSEVEADMAQGALESEGIAAIVWKDDAGGMYPSFQPVRGVALRVAPEDLEQARIILEAVGRSGGAGDYAEETGADGEDEESELEDEESEDEESEPEDEP